MHLKNLLIIIFSAFALAIVAWLFFHYNNSRTTPALGYSNVRFIIYPPNNSYFQGVAIAPHHNGLNIYTTHDTPTQRTTVHFDGLQNGPATFTVLTRLGGTFSRTINVMHDTAITLSPLGFPTATVEDPKSMVITPLLDGELIGFVHEKQSCYSSSHEKLFITRRGDRFEAEVVRTHPQSNSNFQVTIVKTTLGRSFDKILHQYLYKLSRLEQDEKKFSSTTTDLIRVNRGGRTYSFTIHPGWDDPTLSSLVGL